MKKLAILSSLLLLALNSCSNEDIINEELTNSFEKRITVVAEDLTPAEGTRTSYTENGNGYSFAWSEGDALGIFPENGYQTAFPIGTDGVGSNTAVFDGGKWALRPNESYAAYYPLIHDFDLDPSAIPFDYTGQVQDGNGSTAHLSKYDFMASAFEKVDDKGNVNFQLQHLGCLVQFKLTMPEADSYNSLEINSDKTPFIMSGTYSLSDSEHALANVKTSPKITIGLNNVTTYSDFEIITITAMFAPVDLSGSTLTLTIKGSSKDYTFEVEGQNLQNGMTVDGTKDTTPYITFYAEAEQTLSMSKYVETIEYSINNSSWTTLGTNAVTFGGYYGVLRLRGKSSYGTANSMFKYSTIIFNNPDTKVSCTGDIRTLVDYENYSTVNTSNAKFSSLFDGCSVLTSAPSLPSMILADDCYSRMFGGCTSLTTAPELPATKVLSYSYYAMFDGCIALSCTPALPATNLALGCYTLMFNNCASLISAPELPAKTLVSNCYYGMFNGCTSLTTAPELPAKTLVSNCYYGMFNGCTSLISVPKLPARYLEYCCYEAMFEGCTSLTTAPELPAVSLAERCYSHMFYGCTSLISVPKLPARYLEYCCYEAMFEGCTSLTTAPELPAVSLAERCYSDMFSGCTSLSTAPELPVTTLAQSCYKYMFAGCTTLERAPELLATTLADDCYSSMFEGCTKLNYVKMMATDISASSCLSWWLSGVSSIGTFVKNRSANWEFSVTNDLPTKWTVKFADEIGNEIWGTNNGHEYVDLGLPSGILWSSCNIGATKPEDKGDMFAWGETSPKTSYNWDNYKYGRFDYNDNDYHYLYKYCTRDINGVVDNRTILETADDAAYVNWGESWRIPSVYEWDELIENCQWTWSTLYDVDGCIVTGPNGNKIFLPKTEIDDYGFCSYWTSNLSDPGSGWDDLGRVMSFNKGVGSTRFYSGSERAYGHRIRPIIR